MRPLLALRLAGSLVCAALLCASCSAAKSASLLGIRADAATLEQSSLEYALRGDLPRALAIEEQALLAYRSVDDTAAITGALNRVGNLRSGPAIPRARARPISRRRASRAVTGDRAEEAAARSNLGTLFEEDGDLASADAQYQAARALAESADAEATLATILNNQALLARKQGDPQRAIELLRAALEIDRDRGNEAGAANRLRNLGAVYAAVGRQADAVAALNDALAIDRKRENVPEIALDLSTLSEINARDPATLALAVNQRRRAGDIHRLLGRDAAVARDEAAIAAWCDLLRARTAGAESLADCPPLGPCSARATAPSRPARTR